LLDRLIRAEEYRGETHRAVALAAFGELALFSIPASGVFAPADDGQLYQAIEDIARKHFEFGARREAIRAALSAVGDFNNRDAIATAYSDFATVSDRAYFYGGLAFGVTLATLSDSGWC
jgi:hypothetical protein